MPSPTVAGADRLAAGHEQGHVGVAEPERRQPLELAGEVERERRRGNDRVDPRHRGEILLGDLALRVGGERRGERLELLGPDRQAGGGTMAAEPLQVLGARRETGVEVEARHRSPGALPALALAGDQDDGTAEALDEPRGDDPDHALVPALAPDDVCLRRLRCSGGPGLDGRERLAQDPLLDRLAVAVERLDLVREQVGLPIVLGEDEVQADVGTPEAAGRVEPRREPERRPRSRRPWPDRRRRRA